MKLEEEKVLKKNDFSEEPEDHHSCNGNGTPNGNGKTNGNRTANGNGSANGIANGNGCHDIHEKFSTFNGNGCHRGISEDDSTRVCLKNIEDKKVKYEDTLHQQAVDPMPCSRNVCKGSLYKPIKTPLTVRPKKELLKDASSFLKQYFESLPDGNEAKYQTRLEEITKNITVTGSYELTYEELKFGAKTAWRNAPRCIGRIQYSNLHVFDCRHVVSASEMFKAICNHLEYATNNGNLRSAITIFPHLTNNTHPFRVWNGQFISYAGYKNQDGSVTGDPAAVEFTDICRNLGWEGAGTDFDVLPLVLQANGEDPELFEIPPHLVVQVALKHPKYPWFEELGLRWYAVPGVTNMSLDCGGLLFTAVPFNGWYMASEIGRDLCDAYRYNRGKVIGDKMELDTSTMSSLWMDQVVVEVNIAILYSYQLQGITITDHHSASASFLSFMESEHRTRGGCPADWVWVVPPLSGSLTPVFHQEMMNYKLKPSYEYMEQPWLNHRWHKSKSGEAPRRHHHLSLRSVGKIVAMANTFMNEARSRRIPATVLYATETGRSERFARQLSEALDVVFRPKLIRMDEYDIEKLNEEKMMFVVTSTFGDGQPPSNGIQFFEALRDLQESREGTKSYSNVRFTVFGLGSRAYPKFCAAAYQIDEMLSNLGMKRIHRIGVGDLLKGQEASFESWSRSALKESCAEAKVTLEKRDGEGLLSNAYKFRISPVNVEKSDCPLEKSQGFVNLLSTIHSKKVFELTLIGNTNLQSPDSGRRTNLIVLSQNDSTNQIPEYSPGDHLGVFPKNEETRVQKILDRTFYDTKCLSADVMVRVESKKQNKWVPERRLPPTTLRTALTYLLDITTPPDQMFLESMSSFASDAEELCRLDLLSQSVEKYEEWKTELRPPLDIVLEEFSSVKLPAALLLSQLPLLQPRYYSLSSSINSFPDQAHLTVGVVEFNAGKDGHGPKRKGLCSTWLESLKEGDKVPVVFRANDYFHLPAKQTEPMILIGAGTGIAPFMSFFYQRKFEQLKGKKFGKIALYFGCRRKDHDLIYQEEIQRLQDENVISDFRLALSREPGLSKTYVQHLIHNDALSVYNQIVNEHGHVYLCGNITMAQRVEEELCSILCQLGNMNQQGASDFIERLCRQNRYHKDIY